MKVMENFKGTKGEWYIERTSDIEGDFQGRILSNLGKIFHAGEEKEQIMIIAGEPKKQNGQSNIHVEANAKLIAAAPELLSALKSCVFSMQAHPDCEENSEFEGFVNKGWEAINNAL